MRHGKHARKNQNVITYKLGAVINVEINRSKRTRPCKTG